MTIEEREAYKKVIDSWRQYECCRRWRFDKFGLPHTGGDNELSDYFAKHHKKMGGFTPEISKDLGWSTIRQVGRNDRR